MKWPEMKWLGEGDAGNHRTQRGANTFLLGLAFILIVPFAITMVACKPDKRTAEEIWMEDSRYSKMKGEHDLVQLGFGEGTYIQGSFLLGSGDLQGGQEHYVKFAFKLDGAIRIYHGPSHNIAIRKGPPSVNFNVVAPTNSCCKHIYLYKSRSGQLNQPVSFLKAYATTIVITVPEPMGKSYKMDI